MKTILKPLLFLALVTLSCSKNNDNIDDVLQSDNTFFAKVNGEDFVSNKDFVSASYSSNGSATALVILASDVPSISLTTGKALGITFSSDKNDFELKSGMVLTPNTPDVFLLSGVYAEIGYEDYEFVENTSISLEITNIDTTNKRISGKFSFTEIVEDDNGNRITYNVTDGVFNDVLYTDDD